ncbi:MAG: hypothetical protein H5U40_16290 [Polyangiaceae bacterium]|nr:hypothetical protein [Polyangiaceae bacterium]
MARSVRVAGTLGLRLLAQEGLPDVLREIAEAAVRDAREFYVRVDVDCSAPCAVKVNDAPEEGTRFFVPAAQDVLIAATFRDGTIQEQTVRGASGEAKLVSFLAASSAGEAGSAEESVGSLDPRDLEMAAFANGENPYRISRYRIFSRPRATFFAVLAPTVVGTGMVTWSAIDTRRSRGRLDDAAEGTVEDARNELEHERNVRRTKWIAVEVGAFVFATAMIAAFTDWTPHGDDPSPSTQADIDVTSHGATLSVTQAF